MKYLFSDLDGTLMLDENGKVPSTLIPSHNIEAIKKWEQLGNEFGIATGRPHNIVSIMNKENNLSDLSVCENGMIVSSKNKIIFKDELDQEDLKIAVDFILENNMECLGFYADENIAFYNEKNCELPSQTRIKKYEKMYKFIDLRDVKLESVIHLTLLFSDYSIKMEQINELQKLLNNSKIVASMKDGADFVNEHVSKLNAIKEFAKLENIDHSQIGYVGDGLNDLECLNYFEHSFVMKNSTPELFENLNNENHQLVDSVADAIKKFIEV